MLASAVKAVPALITAILILLVTRWLASILSKVLTTVGDNAPGAVMSPETAKGTRRIAIVGVWLFGVVLAYPYLPGSGSDAFKGVSVLLGLMVSLGSAGMVNQVMSGFVLLYSGSVRTGEYIQVGKIEGKITEIGILAVKLLTPKREFITIPNAVMLSNPTTNFSRLADRVGVPIICTVTIGYDTPWRQVHSLLTQAAEETEGVVEKPPPRVVQKALSDWYPEYDLVCYVSELEQRVAILSELNGKVQDAFNEAGVQIMSPHFRDQPEDPVLVPRHNGSRQSRNGRS
jgi:small-conductance mechanosensitive channel